MRCSRTRCKECGASMQKHPVSLDIHLRKHGLDITSYWMKHIRPQQMPYKIHAKSSSDFSKPSPGVLAESLLKRSSESEQVRVKSRTGLIGTYHGGVIKKVEEKVIVKNLLDVKVPEGDEKELIDFNNEAAGIKKTSIVSAVKEENGSNVSVIDVDADPLEINQSDINEPLCIITSSYSISEVFKPLTNTVSK